MFGAGSETTAASITVMIMAAACHPQAQAAVQRELDRIVGLDRGEFFYTQDNQASLNMSQLPV